MRRAGGAKTKGNFDGTRQICFRCAFSTSKTCADMSQCRASRTPGIRLHIDLADKSLWGTGNYPLANWKPLVSFQRRHSEFIHPTAAMKALVPGLEWKLD